MTTFEKVRDITVEQLSVTLRFLTKLQKKSVLLKMRLNCWTNRN